MNQKTTGDLTDRGPDGRFQPGNTGNPSGRPRASTGVTGSPTDDTEIDDLYRELKRICSDNRSDVLSGVLSQLYFDLMVPVDSPFREDEEDSENEPPSRRK